MSRLIVTWSTFAVLSVAALAISLVRVGPEAATLGERANAEDLALAAAVHALDETRPLVVWLGDSTTLGSPETSYPAIVASRLRQEGPVGSSIVAATGLDFFWYFCLLGEIMRADPALVVLVANPVQFTTGPTTRIRPTSCAWIPLGELPRAFMLPWGERGITAARLVGVRVLRSPFGEQTQLSLAGLQQLAQRQLPFDVPERWRRPQRWLAALEHGEGGHAAAIDRFVALWRVGLEARVDARSPMMQMVDATVRMAGRANVPVLVVGNPVPANAREGLAPLRERFPVRAVVEDAGGEFLDLHDLLAQSDFRDGLVHFGPSGAAAIADELVPVVRRAIGRP